MEHLLSSIETVPAKNIPKSSKVKSDERYDLQILYSIRRIIRANDMHSKELESQYNITSSQLVTLQAISQKEKTSIHELAKIVSLDGSTLVGVIDRLEAKHLVKRERSLEDRRQVAIYITDEGKKFIKKAPSPLQSSLAKALTRLDPLEQSIISKSLDRIVEMINESTG